MAKAKAKGILVVDANNKELSVGDVVSWTSSIAGRRSIRKRATITMIRLDTYIGDRVGREVSISADIDNGLKDTLKIFVTDSAAKSARFSSIEKL